MISDKFDTDQYGQVITEPCYDAELQAFKWFENNKTIHLSFLCPNNTDLKIIFNDIIEFKVNYLQKYNISTTFFVASGGNFDENLALSYIEDLFYDNSLPQATIPKNIAQKIRESLNLCKNNNAVLFANDSAIGCVLTILCKKLTIEITPLAQ